MSHKKKGWLQKTFRKSQPRARAPDTTQPSILRRLRASAPARQKLPLEALSTGAHSPTCARAPNPTHTLYLATSTYIVWARCPPTLIHRGGFMQCTAWDVVATVSRTWAGWQGGFFFLLQSRQSTRLLFQHACPPARTALHPLRCCSCWERCVDVVDPRFKARLLFLDQRQRGQRFSSLFSCCILPVRAID